MFRITGEQLDAAGGRARCGRCRCVFDARGALSEQSPSPATQLSMPLREPAPETEAPEGDPVPGGAVPAVLEDDVLAAARSPSPWSAAAWNLVLILLTAALALQYAYFMRADVVRYAPTLRPWLVRMCQALDCELPLPRDVNKLRLLSREVAVPPDDRRVLLIQAAVVNTADHVQAFPVIELKLSDTRGRRIAMRRFKPHEYLPDGTDMERGMAPQTPVNMELRVVKPSSEITNYQFEFM
ncbi:MAG: DUF3426 domain-containing protein [Gammaproteobacteria bacterium]|nr:DUF3426 domain-containing protein [Gammaproteobacteria bacterium]NIR97429.1 DUF3426 domain-containing protein [Gammaproteobacteria bacterium]